MHSLSKASNCYHQLVVKICDFGLARILLDYSSFNLMNSYSDSPIKHTSGINFLPLFFTVLYFSH